MLDLGSKQVSRATYSQQVYDLLTEKLLSGEFKPGQILTLRSLAADFSVSIIPVREALSLLEAEGVILRRSNRDYRIRELSYDEYNDIMDLRAIMESKAAVFACNNAQTADYAGLKEILDSMQEQTAGIKEYIFRHYQFHMALYKIARHQIYLEMIKGLWARVGSYITMMGQAMVLASSIQGHVRIYEALVAKDQDALVSALLQDLMHGRMLLGESVFRNGPRE